MVTTVFRKLVAPLSVKTKVTLAATALFLLSLLLVASIQLYHVKVEILQLLGEQQHGFVARVADEIDQKLQTNLNAIAAAASALPPELVANPDRLEKWAQDRRALRSLFTEMFVVSADGSVLVDVPARGRRGLDVSEQENFRTTVDGRKPYISKPFISKALKQPIVTMSAPVFDRSGRVVAVLTGSINLLQHNFLGSLSDAKVGQRGSFTLATRERLIITSTDKNRIMTQGLPPGVSPHFDHAMAGGEGWGETSSRGLHALISYSQLEAAPWALAAALPMDEALAPVRHARLKIMQATLLLALLVAPLIWYVVRRLYDPLEESLRESHRRFSEMLGNVQLVSIMLDREARITYCNDYMLSLTGWTREEILGRSWFELFIPPDAHEMSGVFADLLANLPSAWHHENEILTRAGGRRLVRWNNTVLRSGAGEVIGTASIGEDITEQKHAELKIKGLSRVHAVLSGINSLIVRVHERDELFREACRIAVEHGGFKMAWIGVVDRAAMKIAPIAATDAEPEFLTLIQDRFSLREDAPMGNTMSARAVREKKPMVSNDIRSDASVLFSKERIARGIASMAVLPLLVSGEAVGVLGLYAGNAGFFDDAEMKLLRELAGDISFALEHIEKTEKLDYLAYHDQLTGIANRTLFLERLEERLPAARDGSRKVAVTVIDIERLAAVNDAFGRRAGDELLRQVAERLERVHGDPTGLARIGPGTFAVLSPGVERENDVARMTEHKLSTCFTPPFRIADQDLRISARAGVALYPNDAPDAESLLLCAEAALKKARDTGERYLFFTPKMTERIAERLGLESRLRRALEKEEFVLHYQPKVDLQAGNVASVEALIRWQSPELGLVPPMNFIPLLEETGLILEVGSWALRRAARDHRDWVEAGLEAPRVAVNVSPIQLRQRDFVQRLEQAIVEGAAPAGIDLEITESLIMRDIEGNIGKLNAIRALGVQIAIDDFGTGYSSLAYLAKLPVEMLKIDRAFIVGMTEDPDASMLVQTMISLAHSLRLKVVAEGVETPEQVKMLKLLRCDQMQGYVFSKPLPKADLVALLRKTAAPNIAARLRTVTK